MKKIILLLGIIMVLPLVMAVQADEPDYLLTQFKEVDLKIPCQSADGSDCPQNTTCNLTITYPDGTLVTNNAEMTNAGAFHNRTFEKGKLDQNGEYNGKIVCNSDSSFGASTFVALVSPSGSRDITLFFFIIFGLVYLITFVGAYFENEWLVILGGMAMIIIGFYSIVNGIDIYKNLATQAISITTLGIGAYFSLTAGIRIIQDNM